MPSNPTFNMISRDELCRRVLDSARNVFSVMAGISLEECPKKLDEVHESWVTAIVGFEGGYSGMVALHCSEALARRITAGLLQSTDEVDRQDLFDALGEVVNIIGGDIKLCLDRSGRKVLLSIPMVYVDDGQSQAEYLAGPETVACTMAVGNEQLLIGVQVNRNE